MTTTTAPNRYQDTKVDVKLVLSSLWIVMLFVFAYVDIFGFFRADVLGAALDGRIATTTLAINQLFLMSALIYILIPTLMVILSLLLPPRVNRTVNVVVSIFYATTVLVSCIGEQWLYYIVGSVIEAIILATIALTAWRWPFSRVTAG